MNNDKIKSKDIFYMIRTFCAMERFHRS